MASRARRIGRALAAGGKGSGMAAGSGVALYFLHKMLASKVELVQRHPVATPLALAAAGHFLKRKMPTVGTALIGGSGYAFGMALDVARAQQAQPAQAPTATQTQALLEASALTDPMQVGDFVIPDAGAIDYDAGIGPNTADLDISQAMDLGI